MRLLQIIRWKNLLLIALVQVTLKYYLMPLFNVDQVLNDNEFILIVLATFLIAIGGYIINDIYDIEIDRINKPDKVWIPHIVSMKYAKLIYYIVNVLGLVLGLYVSVSIGNIVTFLLFLVPVVLLYWYAVQLKKILFIGNIVVSLLVAFSLLIIVFFEWKIFKLKTTNSITIINVIYLFLFFAFSVNLTREIVKDAEDTLGDKASGLISIPIKYGLPITQMIIRIFVGIISGIIITIVITQYKVQPILSIYLILAVLVLLFLFINQLNKATKSVDYGKLSTLLKIIMLVGILSVFMIKPL